MTSPSNYPNGKIVGNKPSNEIIMESFLTNIAQYIDFKLNRNIMENKENKFTVKDLINHSPDLPDILMTELKKYGKKIENNTISENHKYWIDDPDITKGKLT